MSKLDTTTNLDFTALLTAEPKAPQAPALPVKLPEEIVIGARALKKGGYFVNITNPRLKRIPRPASPTILIIEDEPDTLALIGRVLDKEGYRTRKAASGATFVTAMKQAPIPDLILLDLELPDVSGLVILTKLRAHAGTKAIPIVVLSAHSEPKAVYKCMSLGADGYISKPTRATTLVQAVRAVLGG